jgi:ATP-dependent Lhr-like helicase
MVRRAGALVVIVGGVLRMYLAQGGRSLLTWFDGDSADDSEALTRAAQALAVALRRGKRQSFTLDLIDEVAVGRGRITDALRAAGFRNAPRGLSWEG